MKIVITCGFSFAENTHYLRVDMYKTHDAYLYPEEHEGEIWNTCCAIDMDDTCFSPTESLIDKIMKVVETSVNTLLEAVEEMK